MPVKKRKTLTKYQRLRKAKKSYCAGRITKAALNKVATAYVKDAVKKGNKTQAEAKKAAAKVVNGKCTLKKKGTTKRRKSTRRRRA